MINQINKIIISFSICALALLVSCDVLDLEPKTQWSSTNMPTELAHLQGLVRGGYQSLGGALQQGFLIYGDERADVYYVNDPTATTHDKIARSMLEVEMSQANWRSFYQVIKNANVVIHHTPEMISNGMVLTDSQARRNAVNTLLGQAYCQRAFAYLWIIRIWGDAPIVTEPIYNSEDVIDVPRSPVALVLEQMHHDLDSALKYIPAQTTAASITRTAFSPVAARAIKAHAYMWDHQYEKAIEQLDLAIPTSATSSLYRLATLHDASQTPVDNAVFRTWIGNTEFSRMFNSSGPSSNLESIFELSYSEDDGDINNVFDSWFTATMTTFRARDDFHSIFPGNDFRLYASFGIGTGKIAVTKWVFNYTRGNPRNILLIRLADLKLLRAEARMMLVPESSDLTDEERTAIMLDINDIIRRARGPLAVHEPDQYLDRDVWLREDFVNVIKMERRRELAFEGHRWFDLVRWGDAVEALAAMEEAAAGYAAFNTGPVDLDPRGIVWPIHISEIRRSKYIEQNEFYR